MDRTVMDDKLLELEDLLSQYGEIETKATPKVKIWYAAQQLCFDIYFLSWNNGLHVDAPLSCVLEIVKFKIKTSSLITFIHSCIAGNFKMTQVVKVKLYSKFCPMVYM